jgi:ferrochelatase
VRTVPFDAVLVIAFGGPLGPADVRPFLANVVRGRRVPPERLEEVAHHYDLFGGVSPLSALTHAQARGLGDRLRARGYDLPVRVGMRNWHPYLHETLAEMSREGLRRVIGFIAAPHRSYSSCTQYRENVRDAQALVKKQGLRDVEVVYVGDWHLEPGFIEASAERLEAALAQVPSLLRPDTELLFTAHSIPVTMADRFPYQRQFEASAAAIAERIRETTGLPLQHGAVYQSRSGRPEDPWLGPDILDALRARRAAGVDSVVVCPAGFLSDHIEVLYDLDVEAAQVCREIGLTMVRARTVNDHPAFVEMMASTVVSTIERYAGTRPLPLAVRSA